MPFLRVHSLSDFSTPGRLYDHTAGNEVFKTKDSSKEYLIGQFYWLKKQNLDYFIAISWGEDGDKILDLVGYFGVKKNWKTNAESDQWVIRNGIVVHSGKICGEGRILVGREEEHRRKTRNLKEYLDTSFGVERINRILRGK